MNRKQLIQTLIEEIEVMRGVHDGLYVYPDETQIAERLLNVVESSGYCNLPWSREEDEG